MAAYQQRVSVPLDYPVYFTEGVLSPDNPDLAEAISRKEPGHRHRCLFVIERRVSELWPKLRDQIAAYAAAHSYELELVAEPLVVDGGEKVKNDAEAPFRLHRTFDALAMDRHAVVVAIGGGAMLDMVGYAAATAHRGLRLVRVPTTVL